MSYPLVIPKSVWCLCIRSDACQVVQPKACNLDNETRETYHLSRISADLRLLFAPSARTNDWDRQVWSNSPDIDQTTPRGSGSLLFATSSALSGHISL